MNSKRSYNPGATPPEIRKGPPGMAWQPGRPRLDMPRIAWRSVPGGGRMTRTILPSILWAVWPCEARDGPGKGYPLAVSVTNRRPDRPRSWDKMISRPPPLECPDRARFGERWDSRAQRRTAVEPCHQPGKMSDWPQRLKQLAGTSRQVLPVEPASRWQSLSSTTFRFLGDTTSRICWSQHIGAKGSLTSGSGTLLPRCLQVDHHSTFPGTT